LRITDDAWRLRPSKVITIFYLSRQVAAPVTCYCCCYIWRCFSERERKL